MVKRAIGVNKYTGSKKLFDALGIIEIENNIKMLVQNKCLIIIKSFNKKGPKHIK